MAGAAARGGSRRRCGSEATAGRRGPRGLGRSHWREVGSSPKEEEGQEQEQGPEQGQEAGAGAGGRREAGAGAGEAGRGRSRGRSRGRGRDRRDRSRRQGQEQERGRCRRQEQGQGCVICLACGPLYDSASSPITTISSASPVPPRPPTSNCARPRCRHKENGGGISASSNTLARIRKQSRQAALQKSGRGGGAILLSWDESVPSVVNARRSEPRNMPPTREEGAPNDTPPRHPC